MNNRIPDGFELARTTPTFTNSTVPAGLLAAHCVADGVWARLIVHSGEVEFVFEDDANTRITVAANDSTTIPPSRLHHVELDQPATFALEFHRAPTTPSPAAEGAESTGLEPQRSVRTHPKGTNEMTNNEDSEPAVNINPHGFVGYPTDHVYGIVDDPANDVPKIIGDLLALDVATEAIHVYCCRQGLDELSPSGQGYGLKARVQRILQTIGYEGEHMRQIERELTEGHAVVGVAVDDHDAKRAVAAALHKQGGHDIHYYARFTIEDL